MSTRDNNIRGHKCDFDVRVYQTGDLTKNVYATELHEFLLQFKRSSITSMPNLMEIETQNTEI